MTPPPLPLAFSVRSPDHGRDPDEAGLAASLPELMHLHRARMLVVEDDPEILPLVRAAAATSDPPVELDCCTRAEQARRLLRSRYYDVVLADFMLDGPQDGLSLRADCWSLQPQAIFAMTSSYPLPEYLHSVGGAGSPFLAKPFDVGLCRDFVSSLLSGGTNRRVW